MMRVAFHRAALLCALLQHAAGFVSPGAFAPAHPVGKVRACAQRLRHGPAWQYARTVCASRNRIYILGRCRSRVVLDVLGGELCVS